MWVLQCLVQCLVLASISDVMVMVMMVMVMVMLEDDAHQVATVEPLQDALAGCCCLAAALLVW